MRARGRTHSSCRAVVGLLSDLPLTERDSSRSNRSSDGRGSSARTSRRRPGAALCDAQMVQPRQRAQLLLGHWLARCCDRTCVAYCLILLSPPVLLSRSLLAPSLIVCPPRPRPQAEELIDTAEFIDGEWGDPQTVTFNQRDLLLYAVGIGCTEMKFICEAQLPRLPWSSRCSAPITRCAVSADPALPCTDQTSRTRSSSPSRSTLCCSTRRATPWISTPPRPPTCTWCAALERRR